MSERPVMSPVEQALQKAVGRISQLVVDKSPCDNDAEKEPLRKHKWRVHCNDETSVATTAFQGKHADSVARVTQALIKAVAAPDERFYLRRDGETNDLRALAMSIAGQNTESVTSRLNMMVDDIEKNPGMEGRLLQLIHIDRSAERLENIKFYPSATYDPVKNDISLGVVIYSNSPAANALIEESGMFTKRPQVSKPWVDARDKKQVGGTSYIGDAVATNWLNTAIPELFNAQQREKSRADQSR